MSAAAVDIAEMLVELIGQAELSQEGFVVQRSYAEWDRELHNADGLELEDTEKLHVDIVTHTTEQEVERASRNTIKLTVPVDIAVRRKFGTDKQDDETGRVRIEEIDALVLFVQEIVSLLVMRRLSDECSVSDAPPQILANPLRQHLRDLRQFTGLLRFNFRHDIKLEESEE